MQDIPRCRRTPITRKRVRGVPTIRFYKSIESFQDIDDVDNKDSGRLMMILQKPNHLLEAMTIVALPPIVIVAVGTGVVAMVPEKQ